MSGQDRRAHGSGQANTTTMIESSTVGYPSKFQIDFGRWRCGGKGKLGVNALGEWETQLRNPVAASLGSRHHMCCLGLMLEATGATPLLLDGQVNLSAVDIVCRALPDLAAEMPEAFHDFRNMLTAVKLPDPDAEEEDESTFENLALAINDDVNTTIQQKMQQLKELFARVNIELEFINVPDEYL